MWAEIRSDFYDDVDSKVYVDAWQTEDSNEEGEVIAKIDVKTKDIEYLVESARTDAYAQEIINDVMIDIDNGIYNGLE